jgi:UPF0716 family protein affecting phage T7 exclusion
MELLLWLALYVILFGLLYFARSNFWRFAFFTGFLAVIFLPSALAFIMTLALEGIGLATLNEIERELAAANQAKSSNVIAGALYFLAGLILVIPGHFANRRARRRIAAIESTKPARLSMLGLNEN